MPDGITSFSYLLTLVNTILNSNITHASQAELITYISDMYTGLNFADYAFGAPVDESTKDLDAKVKDMHKRSFREPDIFAGYE